MKARVIREFVDSFEDGLPAQKMAADSSVPAEMRELGRVIQHVMLGDQNVDVSSLPREWAEAIERMKDEKRILP